MNENITEKVLFERCHDKLVDRVKEVGEDFLETDTQFIALINEEVELARIANDAAMYMLCYEDLGELAYSQDGAKYKLMEKEMLSKAAELGDMEASRRLVDYVFTDGDFNEAARCAVEHLKRGGEVDDFEWAELEPRHDCPIEDNETLPWLKAVMEVRPSDQCRYVLARCYWDIEDLINSKLLDFDKVIPSENDENHDKALSLYQQAADDGYFWAQYYYGLYLLFVGGEVMEKGVAYLEKALTHIPEVPEPDEDSVENDETREWLRANIEKSLFKCTGRTSTHIIELEKNAQQHDLMACVELTIAYLEGNECQRDRDKAFDYASRLLFEDHEFDQLLIRMDDLPPADREWLIQRLHEEHRGLEDFLQKKQDDEEDEDLIDPNEEVDGECEMGRPCGNKECVRFVEACGGDPESPSDWICSACGGEGPMRRYYDQFSEDDDNN